MRLALMFSGQGSQYLGMGKELYDEFACVKAVFKEASEVLGYDIAQIMFNDEIRLNETRYTQSAMLVFYQSVLEILKEHEIKSDFSFGLSLGEYGAYLHNAIFDFSTGIKIIQKRAEAMNMAVEKHPGRMSAIMGLDQAVLNGLLEKVDGYVTIANYNTYGQLVVSGEKQAVDQLDRLALESGAKRVVNLNTNGAFHSELMKDAAIKYRDDLAAFKLDEPRYGLLLNTTGDYYLTDIKTEMVRQIKSSVKFYQIVERLIEDGVDTFLEIGPKTTLSGFVRRINRDVTVLNIEDHESLKRSLRTLEDLE